MAYIKLGTLEEDESLHVYICIMNLLIAFGLITNLDSLSRKQRLKNVDHFNFYMGKRIVGWG